MFVAIDEARRRALFRFVNPSISDRQWGLYVESFQRLGRIQGGPPLSLVCISEPGSGLPSARWRKEFADTARDLRPDSVFALVTASSMARGIVTAVNWIRPFGFHHTVVGTWDEALAFQARFDRSPTLRPEMESLRSALVHVPGLYLTLIQ